MYNLKKYNNIHYLSIYDSTDDLTVIDGVFQIVSKVFPGIGNDILTIINDVTSDIPFCYHDKSLIIITSIERCWCQIIYQLSHELLHYALPYIPTKPFLWFEEALAQMNSYFVLNKLFGNWEDFTSIDQGYKKHIPDYIEADQKTAVKVNLSDFLTHNINVIPIINNPTDHRDELKYLAIKMLPIFTNHPDTFYFLDKIFSSNSENILDAIKTAMQFDTSHDKQGLELLYNLFS